MKILCAVDGCRKEWGVRIAFTRDPGGIELGRKGAVSVELCPAHWKALPTSEQYKLAK